MLKISSGQQAFAKTAAKWNQKPDGTAPANFFAPKKPAYISEGKSPR
jgi:hypothetical protein